MMSDTLKDIERLADINDHFRRQLDKSNEIILELNHMVAKQAGEIAALRQQVHAMPVDALWRYVHSGALYNEAVLEVRYYTAEDFDNDAATITEWADRL